MIWVATFQARGRRACLLQEVEGERDNIGRCLLMHYSNALSFAVPSSASEIAFFCSTPTRRTEDVFQSAEKGDRLIGGEGGPEETRGSILREEGKSNSCSSLIETRSPYLNQKICAVLWPLSSLLVGAPCAREVIDGSNEAQNASLAPQRGAFDCVRCK